MVTQVARPTPPIGRLFYVRDKSSNTQFLVDTGTEVSVVPPPAPSIHINRIPSRYSQSMDPLITTFGSRSLTLNLGLCRTFRWVFTVADVKQPILGADFLHHFGLHVDIRNRTLSDPTTSLLIHGLSANKSTSTGIARPQLDQDSPYHQLLTEFPELTQPYTEERPVKHSVVHLRDHPSRHAFDVWRPSACESHVMNLTTCSSWE